MKDVEGSARVIDVGNGLTITAREQQLCLFYIESFNATQAAIKAGYAETTALGAAWKLFEKPPVQKYLAMLLVERKKKISDFSIEDVMENLQEVLNRSMQAVPVTKYDAKQKKRVPVTDENGASVWKFDAAASLRALELIGKHLGMFTEQINIRVESEVAEELDAFFNKLHSQLPTRIWAEVQRAALAESNEVTITSN